MKANRVNHVEPTIAPNEHPYMNGAWTPNYDEWDATDMEVIGEIPSDIDGVYVRNTENPVHEPIGRYHPFEGDGMIHAISFRDGKAEYRNRFVRTQAFMAEQEAGHSLWAGLMEHPRRSIRPGWGAHGNLKDASSTDVIVHAGKILSTFYQCGDGYRLDPYTLEQFGMESWTPLDGISAHPKLDERTGELLFFNYGKYEPFMHYGVVGPDNAVKHYIPVEIPGPRLPHDIAFSENYTILNDLPVFWDPELLKQDIHAARFYPDIPSRFGILPRYGDPSSIKWFEAAPTYVLHWLNAWEDGDEVVLDGYFQENPVPGKYEGAPPELERMMAFLDQFLLQPKLHRWRFNLKTGETREERLDDEILEFGTINQRIAGRRNRYCYSAVPKKGWFLFTGVAKHDFDTGRSWALDLGPERYGSEPAFAPRVGATNEDDGYLVTFVTDMIEDRSECVLIDASDIEAGPVCRIMLPHRISSGTHATWAHGEDIRAAAARDAA
ncbi:carotenoid oxygenase family protein [Elongatibacter sediminis]|uniref:Carotenoid oxygenase family protein n=1 Tax=Elongatibacter sediminis TaxID=3119006 RepID=A0AAW9R6S5_9GAMM